MKQKSFEGENGMNTLPSSRSLSRRNSRPRIDSFHSPETKKIDQDSDFSALNLNNHE